MLVAKLATPGEVPLQAQLWELQVLVAATRKLAKHQAAAHRLCRRLRELRRSHGLRSPLGRVDDPKPRIQNEQTEHQAPNLGEMS